MKELTVATRAAKKAGVYIRKSFSKIDHVTIERKKFNEVVTKHDRESERIIVREIKKAFPRDAFLGEESGLKKGVSATEWIIDPIDGTDNFVSGNPIFGVSIAAFRNGKPLVGVIYFPMLNEFYSAYRGKGAFKNGKRIRVSTSRTLKQSTYTISYGRSPADLELAAKLRLKLQKQNTKLRDYGSAVFDLAQVACGHRDVAFFGGGKPWDMAAGVCILIEAGGKISQTNGKPWTLSSKKVIASNGAVHTTAVRFLKKA